MRIAPLSSARIAGIGSAFVFVILLVFGNQIQAGIAAKFPMIAKVTSFIIGMRTFITLAMLCAVFLLIYKFVPNRRASFKSQFPGAIVSSVAWSIFSKNLLQR